MYLLLRCSGSSSGSNSPESTTMRIKIIIAKKTTSKTGHSKFWAHLRQPLDRNPQPFPTLPICRRTQCQITWNNQVAAFDSILRCLRNFLLIYSVSPIRSPFSFTKPMRNRSVLCLVRFKPFFPKPAGLELICLSSLRKLQQINGIMA